MALIFGDIAPVRSLTDCKLVGAVRRGDDLAFEQLFARYRRRIGAYVYGLVGDHGRTEDITQEVFLSALRRLQETDQPVAFRPWIYEIARNACIDEHRRSRRGMVVPLERGETVPGPPAIPLPEHGSPEGHWARKQQLGDLTGAFSGLSARHHRILVMRELEGLSYAEIADRLGMTRAMVESTLFRARRRLAHEYEELASGRRCTAVQAAIDAHSQRAISSLGIRERRRIGRHLGHCHSCLAHARAAGVGDAALARQALGERVGALVPLGWLVALWRRGTGSFRAELAGRRLTWLGHHSGASLPATPAAVAATAVLLVAGGVPLVTALDQPQGPASARAAGTPLAGVPPFVSQPLQVSGSGGAPASQAAARSGAAPTRGGAARRSGVSPRSAGGSRDAAAPPAGEHSAGARSGGAEGLAASRLGATASDEPAGELLTRVRSGSEALGRVVSGAVGTLSSQVHDAEGAGSSVTATASRTATQLGGQLSHVVTGAVRTPVPAPAPVGGSLMPPRSQRAPGS